MAGSTISLDSLSSPSPSPSPPPEPKFPNEPTSAGLDSDSELSELTEEEQEAEKREVGDEDISNGSGGSSTRRDQRPLRRGGRRKRSSMVPPPMWDWAANQSSNVVEEEEEEDVPGPPRAMEEEEGEEEDDASVTAPMPRPGPSENSALDDGDDDRPEEEGGDAKPTINGVDEDEDVSGDDEPTRSAPSVVLSARGSQFDDDAESNGTEDEAEGPPKLDHEAEEDMEEDGNGSDTEADQNEPDVESENETEDDGDELKEPLDIVTIDPAILPQPSPKVLKYLSTATTTPIDMDVDVTAPPPQDVAPLVTSAAAHSIMAGSAVIDPPSPSPSSASSASGSRASSRSPSPAPSVKVAELAETGEHPVTRPRRDTKSKNESELHTDVMPSTAKNALATVGTEVDNIEVDAEHERNQDGDDIEVDDDLEVESELQPAHRAEALDVLATIELKFALLRERVYVEKMEGLAWEESLVSEGTHPELIHLHRELSKRRDKRLELATRKRSYELANVNKRRCMDENATWSWWKLSRDELQTEMITETNRKKRRLERDRRTVERAQPIRRIPVTPLDAPEPPSLRKIVKSFPFSHRRQMKREAQSPPAKHLRYPELSTLSANDVSKDLEFLYHNRRPSHEPYRNGNTNGMGPPSLHTQGYEVHHDVGSSGFGNRMPPSHFPSFQHHSGSLMHSGGQAPQALFPSYSGSSIGPDRVHHQQPPNPIHHHHIQDQEMGSAILGPGPLLPNHPYFGSHGGSGVSGYGGQNNLRRSTSPVAGMPYGPGSKQNGSWMGAGMGMGTFPSKNAEWLGEGRRSEMKHNEEVERDRITREREKERERDLQDLERERQRESYHMQQLMHQQQHRHPPPPQHQPLSHLHNGPSVQVPHHHSAPPHHHHRVHHHHVVHHHHSQPQVNNSPGHGPSSGMPPGANSSHSPPGSRDFENGRPPSSLPQHPTEVINLSSSVSSMGPHWKGEEPTSSSPDYRDGRNKQGGRLPSGPPMDDRERERPLAMPFVMASTHNMQSSSMSPPRQAPANGTSSPRGSWNAPEDTSYRIPSSSTSFMPPTYTGPQDSRIHSPSHRYADPSGHHLGRGPPPPQPQPQPSLAGSPPRARPAPSSPSSSSAFPGSKPNHSPTRFGPPPSSLVPPSRSPPMSSKTHRPSSPLSLSSKMPNGLLPPPIPSAPSSFSPRLTGPGRTSTPSLASSTDAKNGNIGPHSYPGNSRTTSPLTLFSSPSSHLGPPPPHSSRPPLNASNAAERDKEREREIRDRERHSSPPRLSALALSSKLSLPQMVDGH